jgi:hypothetical protein
MTTPYFFLIVGLIFLAAGTISIATGVSFSRQGVVHRDEEPNKFGAALADPTEEPSGRFYCLLFRLRFSNLDELMLGGTKSDVLFFRTPSPPLRAARFFSKQARSPATASIL